MIIKSASNYIYIYIYIDVRNTSEISADKTLTIMYNKTGIISLEMIKATDPIDCIV